MDEGKRIAQELFEAKYEALEYDRQYLEE